MKTTLPNTIKEFDILRYMGRWYEIARINHSFENGLENVTANYELQGDNRIKVINQGYKDKKLHKAIGKARAANKNIPGYLEVSFFLWFYAPYYILYLDPDYRYALVGSKRPNYLWILSRSPQMPPEIKEKLIEVAKQEKYDTDSLYWTIQAD